MSNALKIHPAAVLVMVLVSASLFGFIGVLLSAPVLASVKLGFTYVTRKLMDMDPWEGIETYPPPVPLGVMIDRLRKKLLTRNAKKSGDIKIVKTDNQDMKNKSTKSQIEKGE